MRTELRKSSADDIKYKISRGNSIVFWITSSLVIGTFFVIGFIWGSIVVIMKDMPNLAQIDRSSKQFTERFVLPSRVLDINNEVIAEFWEEKRILVGIDDVSDTLVKAFLSIEDKEFYEHHGVNIKRILGAVVKNIKSGGKAQGASTITQQLARALYFTTKKSYIRKISEMITSILIERRFTKTEILEAYFNKIFLGRGAYGVEAAARTYFGKHVKELNLGECAMLAALPKAPSSYSPLKNPEKAKARQDLVLSEMVRDGFITDEQKQKTMGEFWTNFSKLDRKKIDMNFKSRFKIAPHFGEYVYKLLMMDVGLTRQEIFQGGYQIHTTLNSEYQKSAEKVLEEKVLEYRKTINKPKRTPAQYKNEKIQGALLTINPRNGDILAWCGGSEWTVDNQTDRISMRPGRQPGSSFKPFIYAAAMYYKKITPAKIFIDQPITYRGKGMPPWTPQNYEDEYIGPITVHMGLVKSLNTIAAQVMREVGPGEVINFVRRCGIEAPLQPYLALALGGQEITMLELVNAYSIFANYGVINKPRAIKYVKDRNDKTIYDNSVDFPVQAVPPEVSFVMTNILKDVTGPEGTAKVIGENFPDRNIAGKTGTTNEYKDAWFMGYVPGFVTGVWIGYDRGSISLGYHNTGGRMSASIWANYMKTVLKNKPVEWFTEVPSNVVFANVCKQSGKLASEFCPTSSTLRMAFIKNTEPRHFCDVHSN